MRTLIIFLFVSLIPAIGFAQDQTTVEAARKALIERGISSNIDLSSSTATIETGNSVLDTVQEAYPNGVWDWPYNELLLNHLEEPELYVVQLDIDESDDYLLWIPFPEGSAINVVFEAPGTVILIPALPSPEPEPAPILSGLEKGEPPHDACMGCIPSESATAVCLPCYDAAGQPIYSFVAHTLDPLPLAEIQKGALPGWSPWVDTAYAW